MTQINFTVSSTKDAIDVRWGGDFESSRFHVKLHPNGSRTEANPCLIYVHGGGAAQNDGRLPFIANGNGNAVFAALQAATSMKAVLVGFTAQQHIFPLNDSSYPYRRVDQLGNAHTQGIGWTLPNGNESLAAGALFEQLKVFIMVLKSRAAEFGIDPKKIFLMGSSFGGVRCMLSQITGPLFSENMTPNLRNYYGLMPGVDSTVAGIINHYGCPDFRMNTPIMARFDKGFGVNTTKSINDPIFTQRYTGVFTRAQLAALPAYHTEQLSLLWYLEQNKNLKYLPPVYHLYEFIGQEYARRFKSSTEANTAVTIAAGGSGFSAGQTISVDGGVGVKAKILVTAVDGSNAVTAATMAATAADCGSYIKLPGQQTLASTGELRTIFDNVTCTYSAANGDTATTGVNLQVNLGGIGVVRDEVDATSMHGGNLWWASDPHDDVLMRMIQYTAAVNNSSVSFRYACPMEAQMLDAATSAQPVWTADVVNWMQEIAAGRSAPTGPLESAYYGDYYYSGSGSSRLVRMPTNWYI